MLNDIKKRFPKLDFQECSERLGYIVSYGKKHFYLDEEIFCYKSIGHYTGKMLIDEDNEEYQEYVIDVPIEKLTKKHKRKQFNQIVKIIKKIIKSK